MAPINILGVVGLVLLLLYIAAEMPPGFDPRDKTLTLRYARGLRWFALFSACGMPILMTVIASDHPPREPGDGWAIVCSYLFHGVLGGYMLVETVGFSVTITREGLDCRSGWRRRRFVPWGEITGLTDGEVTKHFVLRTRNGYRYHVPKQCVPGVEYFRTVVMHHL